jgi:hypothetical protein
MTTEMKATQIDNGLHRCEMSINFDRITDLACRINDAMCAAIPDALTQEMFAAHAYFLGAELGLAGAVMDFGTPEPGSLIALMQRAYQEARQSCTN